MHEALPLYHVICILPTGEERIYTRFGRGRAERFAAKTPRSWGVSVKPAGEENRSPVCDGEYRE